VYNGILGNLYQRVHSLKTNTSSVVKAFALVFLA
jgi:hypothetical protein